MGPGKEECMPYREVIRRTAARAGRLGYDARQIEAWMRLEHDTLDALSRDQFEREVEVACQCIDADPELSRKLADSYGL
jgi:hypothetical protein